MSEPCEVFRTTRERGEVVVADPGGDLWCVSGRVPFDDDDTAMIIQAESGDQARATFESQLLAVDGPEHDAATIAGEPTVYINTVFRFATAITEGGA